MSYCNMGRAVGVLVFLMMGNVGSAQSLAADKPPLSITQTQGSVLLSWPGWATNWVLEEKPDLERPIPWRAVSQPGSTRLINPSPLTNGFFRLRRISPKVAGMSGHWRFEEATGTTAAEDVPGGPTILVTNAAWATGRVGTAALHFNGLAGGAGSRAWVNNSNYAVLRGAGQPFSISMWFSPDAFNTGAHALVGTAEGWSVTVESTSPGTNHIVFASAGLNVSAQTLLIPKQWYELTVTYDGTRGSVFLDGNLLARAPGTIAVDDGPIYFGGGVGINSFHGRIDEVRTYTNALSPEQLSLAGYWTLDETNGTTAFDSSIYSHHGAVMGLVSAPGKKGRAIVLGSNVMTIPNPEFTLLPPSGNPFSISLWVQPDSLPEGRIGLMSCGEGGSANWELAIEAASTGETALCLRSRTGIGTLDMRAPVSMTISQWAKLDMTYDGAVATLYVNGRKVHHDSGVIQGSRTPLHLGHVPGAINFNGAVDEVKVYRRDRGESEIGPVAKIMWETVLRGGSTNFVLQGFGPPGRTLTYSILNTLNPTNGTVSHAGGSQTITYHAGMRKGPDALMYTVSDGEFTSAPSSLNLSVVEPHWLSPTGGSAQPLDGSSPGRAWFAGSTNALTAIWSTNNYYDCFYYAPGTYETSGGRYAYRPTAYPGCKHIGSGSEGPNASTLKLVGMWEAWNEEVIFRNAYGGVLVDGFEVHDLELDCNADNNPKHTQGEPVWINLPLVNTTMVESVTIRWDIRAIPQGGTAPPWRLGRAAEFKVCRRTPISAGYVTNCQSCISTGEVDTIEVAAITDQILIQLDRRLSGVQFYSIAELEITGGEVNLPVAVTGGGASSQLDPALSALRLADGNPGTIWASGVESSVLITLPVDPQAPIDSLELRWNCQTLAEGLQLGPAMDYKIRARRSDRREYYDVPFARQPRTAEGVEMNLFSSPVSTDELILELTSREPDVHAYSLKEVTVQANGAPVRLVAPSALNSLWFNGGTVYDALDRDPATAWSSGTQGMIGAIDVLGNNMKFTGLKVKGFGTTPGRECFPFYIVNHWPNQVIGNILVEDCLFTEPSTNNGDGVSCVVLVGNRGSVTNAGVRRCTVRGIWPYFAHYSHAFSGNVIENCFVEDCGQSVYFEPDFSADYIGSVVIRSNRFVNVSEGLLIRFWPQRQFGPITFTDNEVVLSPGSGGWGFVSGDVYGPGRSASITNATLMRNTIRYLDWGLRPDNREGGIYYSDIQNGVFANNLIHLGTASSLRVRICPQGSPFVPKVPQRCPPHPQEEPPPPEDAPPCLDVLPPGYRRAWLNNRNLAGDLLEVRYHSYGVDGRALQQQPPPEIP